MQKTELKTYNYLTEHLSVQSILDNSNIDYEFRPEKESYLGELQKSMMIELLITHMRPEICVFFHMNSNGKYLPFYGYNQLKALIDFMNNEYQLFRVESMPELTGKSFKELPYIMRAELEKPIVKCYFYNDLSCKDLKYILESISNSGFMN